MNESKQAREATSNAWQRIKASKQAKQARLIHGEYLFTLSKKYHQQSRFTSDH
jgi:hypothetical protein